MSLNTLSRPSISAASHPPLITCSRNQRPKSKSLQPCRCPHPGCGKIFSKRSNLKAHSRVHSGLLPYPCRFPGCTKRFRWKSSLKPHTKVHKAEQMTSVQLCHQSVQTPVAPEDTLHEWFGRHTPKASSSAPSCDELVSHMAVTRFSPSSILQRLAPRCKLTIPETRDTMNYCCSSDGSSATFESISRFPEHRYESGGSEEVGEMLLTELDDEYDNKEEHEVHLGAGSILTGSILTGSSERKNMFSFAMQSWSKEEVNLSCENGLSDMAENYWSSGAQFEHCSAEDVFEVTEKSCKELNLCDEYNGILCYNGREWNENENDKNGAVDGFGEWYGEDDVDGNGLLFYS